MEKKSKRNEICTNSVTGIEGISVRALKEEGDPSIENNRNIKEVYRIHKDVTDNVPPTIESTDDNSINHEQKETETINDSLQTNTCNICDMESKECSENNDEKENDSRNRQVSDSEREEVYANIRHESKSKTEKIKTSKPNADDKDDLSDDDEDSDYLPMTSILKGPQKEETSQQHVANDSGNHTKPEHIIPNDDIRIVNSWLTDWSKLLARDTDINRDNIKTPSVRGMDIENYNEMFMKLHTRDKEQAMVMDSVHKLFEKVIGKNKNLLPKDTKKEDNNTQSYDRQHEGARDSLLEIQELDLKVEELAKQPKQKGKWPRSKPKDESPFNAGMKINCKCHEKIDRLQIKLDEATSNLKAKETVNQNLNEKLSRLENHIKDLERAKHDALQEKEAALTRLSEIASARLRENNPGITDLSDDNRPLKLAEKFSELYDNEWTDLFDELCTISGKTEEDAIVVLLNILKAVYEYCSKVSDLQEENLISNFGITEPDIKEAHTFSIEDSKEEEMRDGEVQKRRNKVKRFLKSTKSFSLQVIKQNINVKKLLPDDLTEETRAFKRYFNICTRLCWLMHMQENPIVLVYACEQGKPFSTDLFRHYTKLGSTADFLVWPAMLLHKGGPLLQKGVIQPL